MRPQPAATGWDALLLRVHFYAVILVAPFLVMAALTGLAYTITPQLDRALYSEQLVVDPARTDFASWALLARLSSLGVQAHMGRLFGPVNQILLAALALGLLCVSGEIGDSGTGVDC